MASPTTNSAATTPFAEGDLSTSATSVDMSSDDAGTKSHATPREPTSSSGLLESQIQKLQVRLAELEQQADRDRQAREALGPRAGDENVPFLLADQHSYSKMLNAIQEEMPRGYVRHIMRRYDVGPEYGNAEPPGSGYIVRAIEALEWQLRILGAENERIYSMSTERDRLLDREQKWEEERRELLNKQEELRRLGGLDRRPSDASALSSAEDGLQTDEGSEPIIDKADIKEGDWDWFKLQPAPSSRLHGYAIDVLKGDPVILWKPPVSSFHGSMRYKTTVKELVKPRKPAASSKEVSILGQALIPERIRINSKHIMSILGKIHGEYLSAPSVMIRPYRMLTYYEQAIRRKFQELEEKFTKADANTEDETGSGPAGQQNSDGPTERNAVNSNSIEESQPASEVDGAEKGSAAREDDAEDEQEDEDEEDLELTSSPTAYEHLKCLVRFMDERIQTKLAYLSSDRCQTVGFSDIWYLFKPGDEVIEQSRRQVYRVMNVSSAQHKLFSPYRLSWDKETRAQQETPVILSCAYIDFDGKELGPMIRKVRIARFDGQKAVTALEVYPLRFAEEMKTADDGRHGAGSNSSKSITLRDRIIARGRMFMDMTTFKHMHYSGLTLDTRDDVDSHVVVDFEEAYLQASKSTEKTDDAEDNHTTSPKADTAGQDWRPKLEALDSRSLEESFGDEPCEASCCGGFMSDQIHRDRYAETKRNEDYITLLMNEDRNGEPPPTVYPRLLSEIKGQHNTLSPGELLIMSYRVFGFILRTRKWAQLNLDYLTLPNYTSGDSSADEAHHADLLPQSTKEGEPSSTVVNGTGEGRSQKLGDIPSDKQAEDKTAFGQLVLPEGHKDMVKSLITQHFRDKDAAGKVDIVRGKGKGLIILLHGAPGVGKTTTAEGVAEMFKKPLFQITCGDLGTSAPEVEKALESHFSLANRWGFVLLLDEADVFLSARSKEDFKRNGLVSVFLRVMEYYAGILFLTTNRIGDFDEAFASRIHISLYYPPLTKDNTEAIFKLNLKMINDRFKEADRKIEIEENEILAEAQTYFDTHTEERWNGRQIRNACQTALALAEYRAQGNSHLRAADPNAVVELKVEDLQVVAKAYLDFMKHLNTIRGKNAEMWAKGMKLRAREIDVMLYSGAKERSQATAAAAGEKKEDNAATTPARTEATAPEPSPISSYSAPAPAPPSAFQAGGAPPAPVPAPATISAPAPTPGAPQPGPPPGYQPWYRYGSYAPSTHVPPPSTNPAGYLAPGQPQAPPPAQTQAVPTPPTYGTPEYVAWYQQYYPQGPT